MTRTDAIPAAGIPAAELEERRERLLEQVRARGASGYVLFDQSYIQYLTGFWFLSNERPIAFAQTTAGESAIFVPEFEVARTREEGLRPDRVVSPSTRVSSIRWSSSAGCSKTSGCRARSQPTRMATRGSSAIRARR